MNRPFVIAGAGTAGQRAVEVLSEQSDRKIVLVSGEDILPYDRPSLSKSVLNGKSTVSGLPEHTASWYSQRGVDVLLGTKVTGIDFRQRSVELSTGVRLEYESLLCAPGSRPRELALLKERLGGVCYLREAADMISISERLADAEHVVVVGGGILGSECASSCWERGLKVTLLASSSCLAERSIGNTVGKMLVRLHLDHGVNVLTESKVSSFIGTDEVEGVVLADGTTILCDLVLVAVGSIPNLDMFGALVAGTVCGGVPVSSSGRLIDQDVCAAGGVYAAGDVASQRSWRTGQWMRNDHWHSAIIQAEIAALSMLHTTSPDMSVPYFWTDQLGVRLQSIGSPKRGDTLLMLGRPDKYECIGLFSRNEEFTGAVSCNDSRSILRMRRLLQKQTCITITDARLSLEGDVVFDSVDNGLRVSDET